MSNLPVLWVPPVTPPDPDERPPKRRGNRGVLVAAIAIVGLPLLAVAVHGTVWTPAEATDAVAESASAVQAVRPAATDATPLPKPLPLRVATGPSPETSGGNQPYIAGPLPPKAAPAPADRATPPMPSAAVPAPRTAIGPDGRPVRVIGIDRPSADMAQGEPPREIPERRTKDDTATAPATAATVVPAPVAPVVEPAPAVTAAPIAPATPRGSIEATRGDVAEPAAPPPSTRSAETPAVVKAAPETPVAAPAAPVSVPEAPIAETAAPVSTPAAPAVDEAAPSHPSIVVAPAAPRASAPSVVRVGPPEPGPVVRVPPAQAAETPAEALAPAPVSPPSTKAEAMPRPVPLPPKRIARPAEPRAVDPGESGDFADRLAAIRRAESHRAVERRRPAEPPPAYEDDEEVVVVPRRHWGWIPPFFGGERRGPVLRSYEAPPRVVTERAVRGENCHYHAWPTEDMAFHRTVRCHWHRDAEDASIRYVR